jgi:3'-5' exoribonuclease
MEAVEKIFIEAIKADDQFVTTFLCTNKGSFVGKTGLPYLSLSLVDKTGSVDAKVWDNVEDLTARFDEGDFVKVKANATLYNGKIQLRISNIRAVPDEDVNPADYFQSSKFDIEEMLSDLKTIYSELENKDISRLVLSFLNDEAFTVRYTRAPAAKTIHHPFLGGLLEHTLSLARLAKLVASHYTNLDTSLLLAGVFFHDIGKVRELAYERSAGYTDEGRLLGHITLGVEMLNERLAVLGNFPEQLRMLITHLILSHHGTLEFGSPKRPKFLEAHVLGVIDDLDARVNSWQHILDEETQTGRWSNYQRLYDRYLYRWRGPEVLIEDDTKEQKTDPKAEQTSRSPRKPAGDKPKDNFSNSIRISGMSNTDESADLTLPLWKKQK